MDEEEIFKPEEEKILKKLRDIFGNERGLESNRHGILAYWDLGKSFLTINFADKGKMFEETLRRKMLEQERN